MRPGAAGLALIAFLLLVFGREARAVTQDQMYELWGEAAKCFEAQRTFLPPNAEASRQLERVGQRIVQSWPDRRWISHTFLVLDEPGLGAWSFPVSPVQHRVYVTLGLVQFVRNRGGAECDDLLAGVVGHEIAHLMRDHHLLRHRRAEMLGLEIPADLAEWPARVLGKWQREDEFEADSYGALYAMHAGYRFDGMVRFLGHYLRRNGDEQLLDAVGASARRDHPSLSARIAQLQQERAKIEDARLLFGWGLDLLRVGEWGPARSCFAQVRNVFMLSPTVVHDLAYAELRQYEASVAAGPPLAQCVATDYASQPLPKGPEAAPQRGLLAEAKGDFLKACELDRDGGFLAPRLGLACVYLYEGDDAKAQIQLQEVRVGSDEPAYLNLAGVVAEHSGDAAAALRSYCKALSLPVHASAQEAAAEAAKASDPYLPALYNLAHLLESQGHKAEAAQVYRHYLSFEGSFSSLGVRARDGLLRCGGALPSSEPLEAVTNYRGMDLRSSGALVMKAALGEPESERTLPLGRGEITLCEYPSQGITVALAPGLAGVSVVTCIALSEPNRDALMGVYLGDTAASLRKRLGNPRAVTAESGEASWWDYGRYGLAFRVEGDKVTRCLVGRRK